MASEEKVSGRKPVRGRPGKGRDKDQGAPPTRPVPLTQQIGRIAVAIVVVLFGVFAVVNAQPVAFDWVVGETVPRETQAGEYLGGGVPLIALLLVSFLAGSLVAWFSMWWWTRHRGRERSGSD